MPLARSSFAWRTASRTLLTCSAPVPFDSALLLLDDLDSPADFAPPPLGGSSRPRCAWAAGSPMVSRPSRASNRAVVSITLFLMTHSSGTGDGRTCFPMVGTGVAAGPRLPPPLRQPGPRTDGIVLRSRCQRGHPQGPGAVTRAHCSWGMVRGPLRCFLEALAAFSAILADIRSGE